MDNTKDLSKFGMRELAIVGELLVAYSGGSFTNEAPTETWEGENRLDEGVTVEMNPNSGNVFLVDEDYNVAMFNEDGKLEMFVTCSNCGAEGFASGDKNLSPIPEEGDCGKCIVDREL